MSVAAAPAQVGAATPATFSPRAVFLMLLAGLIGFVGLGVLGAYAPMLRGGAEGGADALSRSAVGYAGVVRVLRESGLPVRVSRDPAASRAPGAGLLVLTPPPNANGRDLATLAARSQRTVLVVLPKWNAAPDPVHIGWVLQAGLAPPFEIAKLLGRLAHRSMNGDAVARQNGATASPLQWVNGFAGLGVLPIARIDRLQTTAPSGAEVLLQDAGGQPVLSRLGQVFVLSEPDLLDNQAMASSRGAHAAVALLDELRGHQGQVLFDVTLNGFGRPRSLLALALAPPFLGASICALAAALLMGAHAAVRFGPARPQGRVLPLGKRALLDTSAQLIALARREPSMGRRYAALVRRSLARRALGLEAPPEGPTERLDAAVDRLSPAGGPPFAALAGDAERASDTASLMRAVGALHQRQTEILGEHR